MASSHTLSSSMEAAISSSNRVSRFSETPPVFQSINPSNRRSICYPKISFSPPSTCSFGGGCSPRLVVSRAELSGESGCEEEDINGLKNDNAFGLVPESTFSLSQDNSDKQEINRNDSNQASKVVSPLEHSTSGGTRAGLFRTPISGGVQSATSAHGLPKPALAVRNLMEQARFAHLCTVMSRMHHRREGYPFGTLVDFAPDSMGHPIFSFSPLAIHTRNLLADPRCTLVVQIPGWSGLSNARVTIFGDVYPLPEDQQEWAHKQYIAKHQQGPSQQWGNFFYFRMQNIRSTLFLPSNNSAGFVFHMKMKGVYKLLYAFSLRAIYIISLFRIFDLDLSFHSVHSGLWLSGKCLFTINRAPYIPNLLVDFHYKHFILMLPVCNQIINLFINELLLYILGLFNSVSWKMSIVCSSSVRLLLLPTSFYSSKLGVPLWNLNM